jgi:hypothetical protein
MLDIYTVWFKYYKLLMTALLICRLAFDSEVIEGGCMPPSPRIVEWAIM